MLSICCHTPNLPPLLYAGHLFNHADCLLILPFSSTLKQLSSIRPHRVKIWWSLSDRIKNKIFTRCGPSSSVTVKPTQNPSPWRRPLMASPTQVPPNVSLLVRSSILPHSTASTPFHRSVPLSVLSHLYFNTSASARMISPTLPHPNVLILLACSPRPSPCTS